MIPDRFGQFRFLSGDDRSIHQILNSAIEAVDPYTAVANALNNHDGLLSGKGPASDLGSIRLSDHSKIYLVGLGKAAGPMVHAAYDFLAGYPTDGLIVTKVPYERLPSGIKQVCGDHPVPGNNSLAAGIALRELLIQAGPRDLVLFFISGGGSALATLPIPGVALQDVADLTNALIRSGAKIEQMNIIRKQIDLVKGGGLARMVHQSRLAAFILSDVIGNSIEAIASGPVYNEEMDPTAAIKVLQEFNLWDGLPVILRNHFSETKSKQQDQHQKIPHFIVGDNNTSLNAAKEQAVYCGYKVICLPGKYTGTVQQTAEELIAALSDVRQRTGGFKYCVIWGGEPVVRVSGSGLGGRNQHLALTLAKAFKLSDRGCFVCMATDGDDGPTDAAGAFVNESTIQKAGSLGLNIDRFLQEFDSYHFFEATGQLLRIGPTGTNVNDLLFYFSE